MPADAPLRFSDARPRYARANVTPGSSSDFRVQKTDGFKIDTVSARETRRRSESAYIRDNVNV